MSSASSISIVRLPHERNYTTIDNAILAGGYLTVEAIGLLAHLLSRPANWTVSVAQLAAQMKCGRDKVQRIMTELRDAGHARLKTVQGDSGQFGGKRWEISEMRNGFASEPAREPDGEPENRPVGDAAENRLFRPSENRPVNKENTDSYKRTPNPLTREPDALPTAEEFERVYPFGDADPCQAHRYFRGLSADERRKVIAHAPGYVADRKARGLHPATPQAYLRSRYWETQSGNRIGAAAGSVARRQGAGSLAGSNGTAKPSAGVYQKPDGSWFLRQDTKNLAAWLDYERRNGIRNSKLTRPAPWPPGYEPQRLTQAA